VFEPIEFLEFIGKVAIGHRDGISCIVMRGDEVVFQYSILIISQEVENAFFRHSGESRNPVLPSS